jgi:hypothetical protein
MDAFPSNAANPHLQSEIAKASKQVSAGLENDIGTGPIAAAPFGLPRVPCGRLQTRIQASTGKPWSGILAFSLQPIEFASVRTLVRQEYRCARSRRA